MSNFFKISAFIISLFLFIPSFGGVEKKLEKGFKALAIFDYFKAKQIFQSVNKKQSEPAACYGLAIIYSRHDNPFTNPDSASKYIRLSFHTLKKTVSFAGFKIDTVHVRALADSIFVKKLSVIRKENALEKYDLFLLESYLCNPKTLKEAVDLRDELEFNLVINANSSEVTTAFIVTHPMSSMRREAMVLRDRQVYDETTKQRDAASYKRFLRENPGNLMVNTAYDKLFGIYSRGKDVTGLRSFVRDYPAAPQNLEAWKLLFSLTVKSYSYIELKSFLATYPDFPLKNSILKDLDLNKLILYPYQKNDFWGFIDPKGKLVVTPVYDAATEFHDGVSLVSRNDSVFFINKENVNPFNRSFSDALNFKNGIAPVKSNGKWSFMNRLGQTVTKAYDEINELSGSLYVVKLNGRYGALDEYGQTLIEPKFEKLGDFKNGFAYFIDNTKYGFVSVSGIVHPAEFEWISDFSETGLAIVKQDNKFGIINSEGIMILQSLYDQVLKADKKIYILVHNGLYGFFSSEGCYITTVAYEYSKEKPVNYYTNGSLFKLLKKGLSIINQNGIAVVSPGSFDEVFFPADGLILAKRKNKFGYLDLSFDPVIPFIFAEAEEFKDSLAIVKKKDNYVLIDRKGLEIYSSPVKINRLSRNYFLVETDQQMIIGRKGEMIFQGIDNIQNAGGQLIVSLLNGEIKLLSGETLVNL